MIILKRYYYAESTGKFLKVTLKELCLGPMPLIWFNNGLYGIICREKIKNMIEMIQDWEKSSTIESIKAADIFWWDEVEIIDPKIGRLL